METEINTTGNEIADRILAAYVPNLDSLPSRERIHFLRRAYRSSGNEEFAAPLRDWAQKHTIPAIRRRSKILEEIAAEDREFPPVRFKKVRSARGRARNALLEERPELQFFRRYLMDMFQARTMGLEDSLLEEEWPKLIETLKTFDFDRIYVDQEVLTKMSSFAVNSVIFLHYLDVDDGLHRRFNGYLRGAYLNDDMTLAEELSDQDYTTFIYNLTHIVIAYSQFYQEWVTGHDWIGQVLADNTQRILERCSFDVIAEVGLSLKLLRLDKRWPEEYLALRTHIVDNYDFSANLGEPKLKIQEHTNAVMLMLFSEVDDWAKGPYFS